MELMEKFVKAQQDLYDHVSFQEDWSVLTIDDRTEMFWMVDEGEKRFVRFAKTMKELNSYDKYYEDEIYTSRHYKKWVYRGEKLTMIMVDTHTDGNKFFAFYKNDKEIKIKE